MKSTPLINYPQHGLSRSKLSKNAIAVVAELQHAGFSAHLVGGCIRDLLLGITPKDFDVATNATPEEINQLFTNSRLIGRRFRLVHIIFRHEIVEVATFRSATQNKLSTSGMILRNNSYGTIEEDVWRRDFTINALYYDPTTNTILDFVDGLTDISKRQLRIIGDPVTRYQEDPVRILRGLRLAAKLKLQLTVDTMTPIKTLAHTLADIPSARLFDEILKWFFSGHSRSIFQLMHKQQVFAMLFPATAKLLSAQQTYRLLEQGFLNSDERLASGKTITPAFLLAVILWPVLQHQLNKGKTLTQLHQTIAKILSDQRTITSIPQRFAAGIKAIWLLQFRLTNFKKRQVIRIENHPRFRAAYDFLLLRATAGEKVGEYARWWTEIQTTKNEQRHILLNQIQKIRRI